MPAWHWQRRPYYDEDVGVGWGVGGAQRATDGRPES